MEGRALKAFNRLPTLGLLSFGLACSMDESALSATSAEGWAVEPEPIASIGVVEGDAPYLFNGITAVRVLPDGRVVVADAGSATVRVFGADGVFERQVGRRGEGPGEFLYLTSLWIAEPDTILAYDGRTVRLSRFLASGVLLESLTFRTDRGLPETYLGLLGDDTHIIRWLQLGGVLGATPVADSVLFGRFAGDSLRGIITTTAGMRRIAVVGDPGYSGPLAFSPHPQSAMVGDTLFHSDGLGGRIEAVGAEGQLVRSFTVGLPRWDLEEAAARLESHVGNSRAVRFPLLVEAGGVDEIPTLSDMLADSESLLWVKAYDPATDSHAVGRRRTGGEWWVLETDGSVVSRVAMPEHFRPLDIRRDLIAGVARDELDVERVVVYELRRGEPAADATR